MTIQLGGREALAVFSYEEEAGMFLWALGVLGDGWSVRQSGRGEIASVLCGPCAGVEAVALDPLPEMTADGTAELVCQDRADFLRHLLPGTAGASLRKPYSAGGSGDERALVALAPGLRTGTAACAGFAVLALSVLLGHHKERV